MTEIVRVRLVKSAILLSAFVILLAVSGAAGAGDTAQEAKNKKLVLDMWQAVIVEASPEAVLKYISPDYKQHNPIIAPGREGLYKAVEKLQEEISKTGKPHTTKKLLHAFADGDLVALTWEDAVPDPQNPGKTYVTAAFDMFRLKDGKIVEHWDAVRKPNP